MNSSSPESSNYGYKDFETVLAGFQSIANSRELHYLTDAIFQLLLPHDPGVEKRFKGGLTVWALWVLYKRSTIKLPFGKSLPANGKSLSSSEYGFRLLQTPAHHDSLAPLLEQIPRGQRALYGYDWEGADDGEQARASGLLQNLSRLTWSKSLFALWKAIRTTRRIQQIHSQIPDYTDRWLPKDFTSRMAELVFRQQLELEVLRQTPCPHRALFLTYELIPETKAWVQWAREAGKRVIHVMHGQRLPTYQVTLATDLLLFSKVDENWFRERVDPQVKIWTIGHPRLERVRKEVGLPGITQPQRMPRIAFFSQPFEVDYSSDLRLRDWAILAGLRGRAEVRFRLHPRESKEIALRDLQRLGADFIELSEAGLKEDLAWCDAVASSWSTVSMEAAACGRGVFWTCTTPEKYEASSELRDAGIGALIADAGDWDTHLKAWNEDGWTAPVVLPDHKLRELGMIGDSDRPWLKRLEILDDGF